ncbi:MAG: DUF3987 domain-containing protein [Deltaproteobacteria bacterium]|nr:DUF3987 domain-containing protein [Deltaproteobacteria bacterium]
MDAEPPYARHVVNDATIEKLGEILKQNPEGVLLYRDELLGFLCSFDKQGHETDRAFSLKLGLAMGDFTSDRIGISTTRIEHMCVSVLGSIQPGPLTSYVRDAFHSSMGGDGLLQRF